MDVMASKKKDNHISLRAAYSTYGDLRRANRFAAFVYDQFCLPLMNEPALSLSPSLLKITDGFLCLHRETEDFEIITEIVFHRQLRLWV